MDKIKIDGTVFSGESEGKKFLDLPWVKQQIKEQLGFAPHPGTLNVWLSEESMKRKKQLLEKVHPTKICPAHGHCNASIVRAAIGTIECAVVVPEVADYPEYVLEIIAAVNLRDTFQLEDGSNVTVTFTL